MSPVIAPVIAKGMYDGIAFYCAPLGRAVGKGQSVTQGALLGERALG